MKTLTKMPAVPQLNMIKDHVGHWVPATTAHLNIDTENYLYIHPQSKVANRGHSIWVFVGQHNSYAVIINKNWLHRANISKLLKNTSYCKVDHIVLAPFPQWFWINSLLTFGSRPRICKKIEDEMIIKDIIE